MIIRPMREPDIDFAADCTKAEGWASETREVFEAFFQHDPSGCFIAEHHEGRIGVCVATPYEKSGFLGELVVTPEARGGTIGPQLFEHAIRYLRDRGITDIYLDGVEDASPYYEFVGFRKICRSYRFLGRIEGQNHSHIRPMLETDLDAVCRLDKIAFGDDRSFFLRNMWERFPQYCKVADQDRRIMGYIMAQPGIGVITAGPWIVNESMEHPEHLLQSLALETGDTPIRLGILETNKAAVQLIRGIPELKQTFFCWRMVLGKSDRLGSSERCYAIGSPAKG